MTPAPSAHSQASGGSPPSSSASHSHVPSGSVSTARSTPPLDGSSNYGTAPPMLHRPASPGSTGSGKRVLICLLRLDLRIEDNALFH